MSHAHFPWLHTAQLTHACVHAWLKRFEGEKKCLQCACRDSPSRLLPSDVSPICSTENLFDAARQISDTHGTLARFTQTQNRGSGDSHISEDDFGYMAKSPHLTGYEPNLPHKMVPADDDATPMNDPDHDSISDFSKTTHENIGQFHVPTVCETSVSHISRGDTALQKESRESLTREPRASRDNGRKETVL